MISTVRACGSVDRASDSGSEGRGFKSLHAHLVMILIKEKAWLINQAFS
jgi:hypothetical protein